MNKPPDAGPSRAYARRIAAAGLKVAGQMPLLRAPLRNAYQHYFNTARGSHLRIFSEIYPDFRTAIRAIPPGRLAGYDNAPSARRLLCEAGRIFSWDYPLLFWLDRLLPGCRLLFDLGGNVGISYLSFRRYLTYPPQLTWLVCDVAAVVAEGEAMVAQEFAPGLRFTTTWDRLEEADILLAAGSLHFIEDPFAALARHPVLPPHLLLNKVPLYALPSAVTLQNMGTALVPNHLFNEREFLDRFAGLGYRVVDSWDTALSCHIPFYPEHSIDAYKGFYLTRLSMPQA